MNGELGFLPGMAEKLGHYVYALVDPRDGKVFYVGKGVGARVYQHAALARVVDPVEGRRGLKLNTIKEIHASGSEPEIEILRHGLTSDEAYMVEAAVIDALRLSGLELANLVSGQARGKGWRRMEDLRADYAAPAVTIEPSHRMALIRINRLYRRGMGDDELYEATRQWWRVSPRRAPDHAAAVYHGIVRAVYAIDRSTGRNGWEASADRSGRWRFTGRPSPELEGLYVWRDVRAYLPDGAQNPVRYVGC